MCASKVELDLMATPDEWPPLYNGHSPWSPLHWNSTNSYKTPDLWPPLYNGRIKSLIPVVAIIEGFHCMSSIYT